MQVSGAAAEQDGNGAVRPDLTMNDRLLRADIRLGIIRWITWLREDAKATAVLVALSPDTVDGLTESIFEKVKSWAK